MVLANFQVKNTVKKAQFFQKMFILANFNIEIVLGILFLTLNNANFKLAQKKLT